MLLAAIGAGAAIALSVAAARRALPPLAGTFNPLEQWPPRKSIAAVALLVVAAGASIAAIGWSDRAPKKLPRPSAAIEWVYSSGEAATIAGEYGDQRAQALRGVAIDSLAFIPSYMLLIAVAGFGVASGWSAQPWAAWTAAFGWSAAFVAAFDYLENAGIYAVLGGVTTRLAPLTYAACQAKWLLGCTAADFILIAFLARLAGAGR